VAVKVQRPGVGRIIRRDLALLGFLARIAHRLPALRPLGLPALVDELSRAIVAQLDFRREVASSLRFAENFADVEHVRVPPMFDHACGDRVITMGFVVGHKLTHLPADRRWDRRELACRLVNMYRRMLLGDCFVHADLHPANILIGDDR
jgi:ubiquinone biosynthesis protein